jgi:hypothetical protein
MDSVIISKTKYTVSAEEMLVDKAQLLTLTAPENDSSSRYACKLPTLISLKMEFSPNVQKRLRMIFKLT